MTRLRGYLLAVALALVGAGILEAHESSTMVERIRAIRGSNELVQHSLEERKELGQEDLVQPYSTDNRDRYYTYLAVTRNDNPLISEDCRDSVARRVLRDNKDPNVVEGHVGDQERQWQSVMMGAEKVPIVDYYDHLFECAGICGAIVEGLILCHMDAVRRSTPRPEIILFETDYPKEGEGYLFSDRDRSHLRRWAAAALTNNKGVMVIARASILGPTESMVHNQRLTQRRSETVRQLLLRLGVRDELIMIKNVGWESPRLVVEEIASHYGFGSHWRRVANPQFMDQSVVLVAFERSGRH